MKNVLQLWLGDSPQRGGGGAGSMYRLHSNLRRSGIDSCILCEEKTTNDPNVFTKARESRTERMLKKITSRMGLNDIHRISSWKLSDNEHFKQADVINFHGMHTGFISYLALPHLTSFKPTIFTLRDMWGLTGHCGVSYECTRWKSGCGNCPYPWTHPAIKRDSTAWEWKLKNWAYGRSRLTVVAVSQWLAEQARQSMLSRFDIKCIYDGVDTHKYSPVDKQLAKSFLEIPPSSKVLLNSSVNLKNYGKGGDILLKALSCLPDTLKKEIFLLTMGHNGEIIAQNAGIPGMDLGFINSHILKRLVFSAADIFVFPSRGEALGQVILESLACGTPVVAQNLGPMPETVRPGVTGLLAESENPQDFAQKVMDLLEDDVLREACGSNGRRMTLDEFSVEQETQNYVELYRQLVEEGKATSI